MEHKNTLEQSLVEWVHELNFLNYMDKGMVTGTLRYLLAT